MKALRGKAVLLDFWTYGCINCIHILPDLKKLEASFPTSRRPRTSGRLSAATRSRIPWPATALKFPGKVLATRNRLYVSDSKHHQIVVAEVTSEQLHRVGTGRSGQRDGRFDDAEFRKPQGLAWVEGRLWVADTDNHLLRAVDNARTGVVTTVHVRQPQSHGGPQRTHRVLKRFVFP